MEVAFELESVVSRTLRSLLFRTVIGTTVAPGTASGGLWRAHPLPSPVPGERGFYHPSALAVWRDAKGHDRNQGKGRANPWAVAACPRF